ncbi:hypothetical protein Micbo1qcDRAFT_204969 [Microdochium bolleyi]|uniref:Uncharacterized protein n=1 Tax=Microdochium bolleyi TaxID=196109 RepID=A0A136J130_9PEZI|nr:hypothetical protein Micbo1qcDRAFT_204969 [Microdochium bolleyi]
MQQAAQGQFQQTQPQPRQFRHYQQPPQQQQVQPPQPPRLNTRFVEDPNRYNLGLETAPQQQLRSPHSAVTTSSTASSLLAKRVGNDRAAALALDPMNAAAAGRKQPWRRQGDTGAGFLSPEDAGLASPLGTGVLPMTPGWRPRLTPTRRGDDLYLNVQ